MVCIGLTEAQKEQYEEDVGHWRIVEARIKRKTQAAAARWKADKKRYESDGTRQVPKFRQCAYVWTWACRRRFCVA